MADLIKYNEYCRNLQRVRRRTKRDAGGKPMRDDNNNEIVEDVTDADGNPVMDNYCKFIYAHIDGVTAGVFSDFSKHIVCCMMSWWSVG